MNSHHIYSETGLFWGAMIGAAIFLITFGMTGELLWIMAMGAGISLGYGIGAMMDNQGR